MNKYDYSLTAKDGIDTLEIHNVFVMEEKNIEQATVSETDLNFELIQSERVEAMYWNTEQLIMGYELYRLNTPSGRIYFRFTQPDNKAPIFYGGATSVSKEIPQEENLIEWIANKGYGQAKRYYFMRSLFGSFEHSRIAELAIMGVINLDEIPERLALYFHQNNFYLTDKERRDMSLECQKDLISVQAWRNDTQAVFLAIELPVFSDHDGIATQIDMVCECRDGKENNPYIALINYKSGKSGFREEHRFQLLTEKNLFLECFPQFAQTDVRSYNLAASNWRKTNWKKEEGKRGRVAKPYSFSEQTPNLSLDRYNAYMELARITRENKLSKSITTISGEMKLGDNPEQFIHRSNIKEIVESGQWKKYTMSGKIVPETM